MLKNRVMKKTLTMAAVVVTGLFCSISAYAAASEEQSTTAPVSEATVSQTSETSAVTTTTSATTQSSTENSTSEVTAAPEVQVEETAETTLPPEMTNPYEMGMLADDDLHNFVMDFLQEGAELDLNGTAVLVDETTLNSDSSSDSESNDEISAEETADSSEKLMYTVVARDGSTFYIIIDKGGNSENVYFLNKVDIVDLASLIDTEEENLSSAEKEILAQANGTTSTDDEATAADEETSNNLTATQPENNNSAAVNTSSGKSNNTTLYIVVGVGAVIAIGIGWYFKVGPGKKNKASFDEEDEDEEYEEQEEYEEEAPVEETYEEDE